MYCIINVDAGVHWGIISGKSGNIESKRSNTNILECHLFYSLVVMFLWWFGCFGQRTETRFEIQIELYREQRQQRQQQPQQPQPQRQPNKTATKRDTH